MAAIRSYRPPGIAPGITPSAWANPGVTPPIAIEAIQN